MTRPHRDPVHGEGSRRRDDPRGVVVAARGRARDDDQQVALVRRGLDDGLDPVGIIRFDRQHARVAAGLPRLLGEHERIGIEDLAWSWFRPDRAHLVAGGHDKDKSPLPNGSGSLPRRHHGRQVGGAQPVAFRKQQLARRDVLADRPDVLVRGNGGAKFGPAGVVVVHVLAHDDRVPAIRHRIAGVHDVIGVFIEPDRVVSLASTVSAARTAIPSIPAASNGGDDRTAQTGAAVTRPAASVTGTVTEGSRAGQPAARIASRHASRACAAGTSLMNGLLLMMSPRYSPSARP